MQLSLLDDDPALPDPRTEYVPDERVRVLFAVKKVPSQLALADVMYCKLPLTTLYRVTLAVKLDEKLVSVLAHTLY